MGQKVSKKSRKNQKDEDGNTEENQKISCLAD
jgi:hypothetical protein